MLRKTPMITAPAAVLTLTLGAAALVAMSTAAKAAEAAPRAGATPVFTLSVAQDGPPIGPTAKGFNILGLQIAQSPDGPQRLGRAGAHGGPSGQRHGLGYDRHARDGFFFR